MKCRCCSSFQTCGHSCTCRASDRVEGAAATLRRAAAVMCAAAAAMVGAAAATKTTHRQADNDWTQFFLKNAAGYSADGASVVTSLAAQVAMDRCCRLHAILTSISSIDGCVLPSDTPPGCCVITACHYDTSICSPDKTISLDATRIAE